MGRFSSRQIDVIFKNFIFFPRKWDSIKETVCMKCRILFSEENKEKLFKVLSDEMFTQHDKS